MTDVPAATDEQIIARLKRDKEIYDDGCEEIAQLEATIERLEREADERGYGLEQEKRLRAGLDAVVYEEDGVLYIKGEAALLVADGQRRARWETGRINKQLVRAALESEGDDE